MDRGTFIKSIGLFTFGMTGLSTFIKGFDDLSESESLPPVLFIGHGSPMNAVEENAFTKALAKLGKELKKPKAILVVSAHWLTSGTFVNASPKPKTIYDFGGFPEELYKVKYDCPGSPEMAEYIKNTVDYTSVSLDQKWGLDHGSWTILKHIYPVADVPVFQLSLDYLKDTKFHYELAGHLKNLRKKGVLIIGSGNITHNLGRISWDENAKPFDWALEFDEKIKKNLIGHNHQEIVDYIKWGHISKIAHPYNDHFLPLLYTIGLQEKNENLSFIFEGIQNGSISMRCVRIG